MRELLLLSCVVVGCGDSQPAVSPDATSDAAPPDADPDALTPSELAAIGQLSPLPAPPADSTNAYADNAKAAVLGQMLFFDKSYAGGLAVGDDGTNGGLGMTGESGKVACASCHGVGGLDADDQRSKPNNVSLGTDYGTRNALGLVNSSYNAWSNWGGRFDSQWSLALAVAENPKIMKSTRLQVAHVLSTKYRAEYAAAFPVPLDANLDNTTRFPAVGKPGDAAFDGMATGDQAIVNTAFVNYGKALQAYIRTLSSGNSRFDQFVAGNHDALDHAEVRGLHLFLSKGCVGCHGGPRFTDDSFHALAVPQTGLHVPAVDLGRYQDVPPLLTSPFNTDGTFSDNRTSGKLTGLAQVDSQKGQFRTRGLRNVGSSGPYMHSGQVTTIEDVINFYDAGGGDATALGIVKDPAITPLGLSATDKADLAAFMMTLQGQPIAAPLLADTSK